jgi:hypothetical protein
LAVSLTLFAGIFPAHAYIRTMSQSGHPLYWSNPSVPIRANPVNLSGLAAAQVSALLAPSLASWRIPDTRVSFSYSQNPSYPANSSFDGANSLYFASTGGVSMEWGVVAVTQVLYQASSGQIAEADITFNDNQFRFTANEGDTGHSIGGRTAIYLRDVATHETGHVLGLDHSLVNQSSLIYTAFSGQFSLSEDDTNAIRTLYPATQTGGALSGTVRGTAGGIFGAHLAAINLENGKVEAGGVANADGGFRLGNIPPGKYAVLMEPFGADISSVSSYYQNVNHRFCSGQLFRRRFYSACGSQGAATVLSVGASTTVNLGTLAPSCAAMGNPGGPPDSAAGAREIASNGGAAWGMMSPGDSHYYLVRDVSGQLSAKVLSYSLYSPLDTSVQILRSAGAAVPGATSVDNVRNPGPGGVTNYDAAASATVPPGDYLIRVSSAGMRIPASQYSAGLDLLDSGGHYLLALGVNGEFGAEGATDMSACVSVPNSPQSASYSDPPPNGSGPDQGGSGCGSLSGGSGPFGGGMTLALGTALAIQLLALASRIRRRALVRRRR